MFKLFAGFACISWPVFLIPCEFFTKSPSLSPNRNSSRLRSLNGLISSLSTNGMINDLRVSVSRKCESDNSLLVSDRMLKMSMILGSLHINSDMAFVIPLNVDPN